MVNYLVSNNNRRVLNKDKLKKDLSNKTLEEIKNTYYELISGYEAILVKLDKKSRDYEDYSNIISDLNTIFKEAKTTKESTKTLLDFYDKNANNFYKSKDIWDYIQYTNVYKTMEPKMSIEELEKLQKDFKNQIDKIIDDHIRDIQTLEKYKYTGLKGEPKNNTSIENTNATIINKEKELLRKRTAHAYINKIISIKIYMLKHPTAYNAIQRMKRELHKPKLKKIIQSGALKKLNSKMFRNLKF